MPEVIIGADATVEVAAPQQSAAGVAVSFAPDVRSPPQRHRRRLKSDDDDDDDDDDESDRIGGPVQHHSIVGSDSADTSSPVALGTPPGTNTTAKPTDQKNDGSVSASEQQGTTTMNGGGSDGAPSALPTASGIGSFGGSDAASSSGVSSMTVGMNFGDAAPCGVDELDRPYRPVTAASIAAPLETICDTVFGITLQNTTNTLMTSTVNGTTTANENEDGEPTKMKTFCTSGARVKVKDDKEDENGDDAATNNNGDVHASVGETLSGEECLTCAKFLPRLSFETVAKTTDACDQVFYAALRESHFPTRPSVFTTIDNEKLMQSSCSVAANQKASDSDENENAARIQKDHTIAADQASESNPPSSTTDSSTVALSAAPSALQYSSDAGGLALQALWRLVDHHRAPIVESALEVLGTACEHPMTCAVSMRTFALAQGSIDRDDDDAAVNMEDPRAKVLASHRTLSKTTTTANSRSDQPVEAPRGKEEEEEQPSGFVVTSCPVCYGEKVLPGKNMAVNWEQVQLPSSHRHTAHRAAVHADPASNGTLKPTSGEHASQSQPTAGRELVFLPAASILFRAMRRFPRKDTLQMKAVQLARRLAQADIEGFLTGDVVAAALGALESHGRSLQVTKETTTLFAEVVQRPRGYQRPISVYQESSSNIEPQGDEVDGGSDVILGGAAAHERRLRAFEQDIPISILFCHVGSIVEALLTAAATHRLSSDVCNAVVFTLLQLSHRPENVDSLASRPGMFDFIKVTMSNHIRNALLVHNVISFSANVGKAMPIAGQKKLIILMRTVMTKQCDVDVLAACCAFFYTIVRHAESKDRHAEVEAQQQREIEMRALEEKEEQQRRAETKDKDQHQRAEEQRSEALDQKQRSETKDQQQRAESLTTPPTETPDQAGCRETYVVRGRTLCLSEPVTHGSEPPRPPRATPLEPVHAAAPSTALTTTTATVAAASSASAIDASADAAPNDINSNATKNDSDGTTDTTYVVRGRRLCFSDTVTHGPSSVDAASKQRSNGGVSPANVNSEVARLGDAEQLRVFMTEQSVARVVAAALEHFGDLSAALRVAAASALGVLAHNPFRMQGSHGKGHM